jgi:tetratricopeptide (TPR) repeat protein
MSEENAMLDILYHTKRNYPLACLLLASLSGLVLGVASYSRGLTRQTDVRSKSHFRVKDKRVISQTDATFDPLKYLPAGAKISNRDKDVVFADLDGDGLQEVIIFYTLGVAVNDTKANILVLKPHSTGYVRLWENAHEGSWGFSDPSGVYDLNKSGRPQIIAYRKIGASCPGVLDIYEYRNGAIKRITGDWADNGQYQGAEVRDLNGNGIQEIIILFPPNHFVNPNIYRWDGKRYVRSNSEFPGYYNSKLEELLQAIYTPEAAPVPARVVWSKQAVEIYILQRRYSEAIQFCEKVLRMIDDPALTVPNAVIKGVETPEQLNRIMASFEVQKTEGKAVVHRLLGDSYKAAGNLQQTREQYMKADQLDSEAKESASKLPH